MERIEMSYDNFAGMEMAYCYFTDDVCGKLDMNLIDDKHIEGDFHFTKDYIEEVTMDNGDKYRIHIQEERVNGYRDVDYYCVAERI